MPKRLHTSTTTRFNLLRSLIFACACVASVQVNAETAQAEKQYLTALLTALSAAEVNHPQMATFANQHLHQATYCLYLTNSDPLKTIAKLTRSVMNNSDSLEQLAHFEKIKMGFDMEYVRSDHPCFQGSYPEDRV